VSAAITLADREGIAAVSTRAVAAAVGASATAIYGYFAGRDDLLVAMRETLLGEVYSRLQPDLGPRQGLLAVALGFRAQTVAHPCLSQIMTQAAVEGSVTGSVTTWTLQSLRALGIEGPLLARGYRQLESFVVGATLFDLANQPHHLEDRLQRMRNAGDHDLKLALRRTADVEADNEAAFAASLSWLIDGLIAEAMAAKPGRRGRRTPP
jgi:AcrR family transcriptional regulator